MHEAEGVRMQKLNALIFQYQGLHNNALEDYL